jgi:hypothetical protein
MADFRAAIKPRTRPSARFGTDALKFWGLWFGL